VSRHIQAARILPSAPIERRDDRAETPAAPQKSVDRIQEAPADAAAPARSVAANHQSGGDGGINRRACPRAAGPFDGRRVGALETPIKIFDLSVGGCFINSMHEQQPGVTMVLKIDLPDQPSITVTAQSLYSRAEFGFAVLFINVNPSTQAKLEQAVRTALAARSTPQ
jgi:hypothetical protein